MRAAREMDARNADRRPSLHVVFEGFVLEPDGAPAPGATVTSSAGGKAITDSNGQYRLEAEVPLAAQSVQITAVGRTDASHSASTRFALASASGVAWVDPLQLVPSSCQPRWIPTFGGGEPGVKEPGATGLVSAVVEFDGGSGPEIYVAGQFSVAGNVAAHNIARWDGSRWWAVGSGMNLIVRALTVFDDGSGPALYAGGDFTTAGGVAASRVARWDGSSWSALGAGTNGGVHALAVHDDGAGPALYAGGMFTSAGGVASTRVAKWDGSSWSPLGAGTNDAVYALSSYDDAAGTALYAAGRFTSAGGVSAKRIAKWDGASWSALGGGMSGLNDPVVNSLAVFDPGSGPALYAGGWFSLAGGVSANRIAGWNGSTWAGLGSGMNWTVRSLAVFDPGSGPALYAGGEFTTAGGVAASGIAKWSGTSWSALGAGAGGVQALATYDGGGGPALVAGGSFTSAGTSTASNVATWDGSDWSPLGRTNKLNGTVRAQAVHDDGSGSALYVGGEFTRAGSVVGNRVARWNGTSWSALGSGTDEEVVALAVYDDGGGPELYAGGYFSSAGGGPQATIAKWDGSSWTSLSGDPDYPVLAMAVHDDGSGPALYVARSNGWSSDFVVKWDSSGWSGFTSVSSGFVASILSLTVHDDGGGPALYMGGNFESVAGAIAASCIAKWDGSSWSALGSGMDGTVKALTSFDDGSGPALYAAGNFSTAGGIAANQIARWDGSSWTPLGGGVSGSSSYSLIGYDHGGLRTLHAGGVLAPDSGDRYLARWGCVPATIPGKVRRR